MACKSSTKTAAGQGEAAAPQASPPPAAPAVKGAAPSGRQATVDTIFGLKIADPYRWLEDGSNAEVQAWMKAKDASARAKLAVLPDRTALEARFKELLYVEWRSAPLKRGKRLFFLWRKKEQEKAALYWQEGEKGKPKLLLDPNTMSADGSVSLGSFNTSWDGKRLAYMLHGNNADKETLHVIEVSTGKVLPDVIDGLRYTSASWTPDGSGFYYTWLPNDPKISQTELFALAEIRFHRLGTDPSTDSIEREKTGDPTKWLAADLSRDGRFLFLHITHGWAEDDVYLRDLKSADPKRWQPLAEGTKSLYRVEAWKDKLYLATNEGAPRWRVYKVDPKHLERSAWKEIVPEAEGAVLDSASIVGGRLALNYLENATSKVEIRTLDGKPVRTLTLPAVGSASDLVGNQDEDTAYFEFSSFIYPPQILRTSIASGKTSLFARLDLPLKSEDYTVEQVWYPSKDGTKISMFLVHAKSWVKTGTTPVLLSGYGGFNVSMTPYFYAKYFPWCERGGIIAVPNLRGGGEYGESWHQDGMLAKKQNVFDDFIGAAEWLIKEGYTQSAHLAISGASNGGLLVGAAMTQRPDLFGAVLCGVPLLDMVRYAEFGAGKAWVPEYGDPSKEEDLKVLYAYSPYHHLAPGKHYPALLMLSADSDDRVDPMHARKFIAQLESVTHGETAVLLRIESKAGHGGADMRKKFVEEAADELAFLLSQVGQKSKPAETSSAPSGAGRSAE